MNKPQNDWDLDRWLYHLEHRHTQEIHLGLARISEVANKLDLLSPACKVINVAGTNGKGSTVAALETIYHTAGYRVGTYTSPHLIHFNERIRVSMCPISDADLCHSFNVIEDARGDVNLTYFEMTTLAGLWHFKQQALDVLILEVGLGGRLDATNIIDADLAIITTIDFDHQDFLGDTLEAIAYEKAGILRKDKPFIYADVNPPGSILAVADELSARSYLIDRDYFLQEHESTWNLSAQDRLFNDLPKPPIQLKSASAALMACLILSHDLPVSEEHISKAMTDIFIPGRLQLQEGRVSILYDVSHNAQSVRLLADTLKKRDKSTQVHAVFSALRDKDIFNLIFSLKDCVSRWYPAQLDNNRAASNDLLLSKFKEAEIFVEFCYNNPLIAFEMALNQAKSGDLIVVYGSFYTVGQVYAAQHKHVVSQ